MSEAVFYLPSRQDSPTRPANSFPVPGSAGKQAKEAVSLVKALALTALLLTAVGAPFAAANPSPPPVSTAVLPPMQVVPGQPLPADSQPSAASLTGRPPQSPRVLTAASPMTPEQAAAEPNGAALPIAIQLCVRPLLGIAAFQQPAPDDDAGIVFKADEFRTDPKTGIVTLDGNAFIGFDGDEIHARKMTVNPDTGQVTAEGELVLKLDEQLITARRGEYNYETHQGRLEAARTRTRDLIVRAKSIELVGRDHYVARGVRYTTCDVKRPHYELSARKLDIKLGKRAIAHNVGVDLFGVRLATVPEIEKPLSKNGRANNRLPLPTLGFNSRDGFFAEKEFTLLRREPLWANFDLRIRSNVDPAASLRLATKGRLHFVGAVSFRDRASNQRSRFMEVDRFP